MANFYGNKVFWAWNGNMDEKQIRQQIRDFARQKLSGFFIHSRCGLQIPYLSDQWLFATRIAIEEARKQGLEVWLYDEDGWPSGFAGGAVVKKKPELCLQRMKCLCFATNSQEKKLPIRSECGKKKDISPEQKIVATFRRKGRDVIASSIEDAEYAFVVERDMHYVDLLNPETTKTFIACTHEVYKKHFGQYFGNTIQGIFTDEPQMDGQTSYSPILVREYRKEYGREYEEDLKYLLTEDETEYKKFRLRYFRIKFRLFLQSYFDVLNEWCKENNLLFVGHLPAEDGLLYQSEIAGCCALAYEHMSYPGIDYLGRRMTSDVLLKTLASVKNFTGLKRVISESFGCCGWDTTFGQYAWIWSYQAAFGINSACLHFSAYSITGNRKRDYPAFFSEQEPWFEQFHYLNDWMAEVNEFVSGDEIGEKIIVISPLYAVACSKEEQARHISNEYRILVEALCDLQLPFDVVDEQALAEHGSVQDGRIRIGKNSYGFAIVPYMDSLFKSTVNLLYDFRAAGGRLLYTNATPQMSEYDKDFKLEKLNDLQREIPYGGVVQNRAALWKKAFEYFAFPRTFYCCAKHSANDLLKDLRMRVVKTENEMHVFLMNKSAVDTKCFYLVSEKDGAFIKRFPEEQLCVGANCKNAVEIELPPMQAVGYVFGDFKQETRGCDKEVIVPEMLFAELMDENKLTIDRCAYCIEDGRFSPIDDVLSVQDEIFKISRTLKTAQKLMVRYLIFADAEIPVKVFVESRGVLKIIWNGEVCRKTEEYFLDREIRAFLPCRLKKGKNELLLEYKLEPSKIEYNPKEVFESDRNRFSYEREIEAVYVCGNFETKPRENPESKLEYWKADGEFSITKPREINFTKDLTPQGYYFFSGRIKKTYGFRYRKGKMKLNIKDMKAACAEVFLNDHAVGCLFSEYSEIDVTKFIKKEENCLQIIYYSGLRNLLGPHHHYRGVVNFTGQNTFIGKRGWEDEITDYTGKEDTSVQSYSFVPFSSGTPILECFNETI